MRPGKMGNALARFWRAEQGAAMLEFGMLALPFFLLTFGLAEICMIGFAQTSLNHAVAETARTIRTGEAQLSNQTYGQIQSQLCTNFSALLPVNCDGNLYIDVDSFASFVDADGAAAAPVVDGQLQTGNFGYSPGSPSNVVVVRAYYRWQVITPLFQGIFGNAANGQRILVSTMMFRSEPYS
ncbi:MAG TPA: TadE/TadG family type IV pilus assembly protein [Caulobacterales bacterium]|nr:TadE/TadG family type IV pilus assembly protein [Caulobacterales bacterium]